jgi:creatinine amidohydrolase
MLERFWIHELTRPAFEEWLKEESAPVVILALGSVEQHGPHLPLGTDSLTAREFVHEVARRTNSVCVHPCFPGYSPHHMGFPGTVTFQDSTLLAVLMDTMKSLSSHGIQRFLICNVHGGNGNIVNLAVQKAKQELRVMAAAPAGPSHTGEQERRGRRQKRNWDVHSGPTETSTALHLFPELVEMWRLAGWESTMDMDDRLMAYLDPDREDYELVSQVFRACVEPRTDHFTSSGVYGTGEPGEASVEEAKKRFDDKVNFMVAFIQVWKTIPVPAGFTGG